VLRGDAATTRIVTWVRGGEKRVDRGPNAGCIFEQRHAGIEAPTAADRGIVIADPFDESMREAWYGVGRCEQMAAALSAESGQPAICGRVGSLWHIDHDDTVWSSTYWAREEGTSVDVLIGALGD
jgi:hypothetical protein